MASFQPNLVEDVEWLKRQVAELNRKRDRNQPRLGDLRDVNGWGAQVGYVLAYDPLVGRYRPMLAPPFLRFHSEGAIAVESSAHDPVGASGRLTLVRGRLTTAGSSTTTAVLKCNSTTVCTLTFASSAVVPTYSPSTVSHAFDSDDYWWLDVTAAGTGAEDLVVNAWATAGTAPS